MEQNNPNFNQVLVENNQDFDPVGDNFFVFLTPFGPLELNILEWVENGLNEDLGQEPSLDTKIQKSEDKKYSGPKEIIFVTGWVNVNSIY